MHTCSDAPTNQKAAGAKEQMLNSLSHTHMCRYAKNKHMVIIKHTGLYVFSCIRPNALQICS